MSYPLLVGLALTLAWLPNFIVTVLIWRNRVTDGQLAAKLPVVLLAGVGVALVLDWLWRVTSDKRRVTSDEFGDTRYEIRDTSSEGQVASEQRPLQEQGPGEERSSLAPGTWNLAPAQIVALLLAVTLVGALGFHVWVTRPFILSITRDDSSQAIVEAVDRVAADAARPATVLVPWGTDYWTLTYEQRFGGRLAGLNLVDHNARPQDIIDRGERLLLPDQTLRIFPLSTFEERLGLLYLASAAPGVVEVSPTPIVTEMALLTSSSIVPVEFDLENGARVRGYRLDWADEATLLLTLYWGADRPLAFDYSTAIHLVAQDPPTGPADILTQADKAHPVDGWYPTTRWRAGEIVRDAYLLPVPADSTPAAVRVAMYRSDPASGFVNTPWLSLPVPLRE